MIDFVLLLKAAILGVVEGATEFIPVSSTGHLILARDWLRWTDERADSFIIFIQLPAILAVVWHYRRKVVDVLGSLRTREASRRLVLNLVIGTIPAVVIGLPSDDWVEANLYNPVSVSIALIAGGFAILAIERWHGRAKVEGVDDIPVRLALGVGIIQVLAVLFPGVSRSGATLSMGRFLGFEREAATRFAFLLAIPAVVGAGIFELKEIPHGHNDFGWGPTITATVVSFVVGYAAIAWLLRYVSTRSYTPFVVYRIVLGAGTLILLGAGVLSA